MCSIPGLPTSGSQANVVITKVNLNSTFSFVELWVNMDDGRKDVYELMRKEIQIPNRKFYGSEGKPEDLCLVCISDTWHRARIISLQCETYNVYLLDQGQSHIAKIEDLAWAQLDTFFLPPEIESCILANVILIQKNLPEDATNFLQSLIGKKLTGMVQDVLMPDRIIVLDVPAISIILTKFGVSTNIPAEEFKCIARKNVASSKEEGPEDLCLEPDLNLIQSGQLVMHDQYFYPELSTDTYEMVEVTEVTDQLNIFCKLQIFSEAVKKLSELIHQHYEECSDIKEPLACGAPCVAKGSDGRWHRSLLKQNIAAGTREVFHVDEGMTELVLVENIRPLLGKFLRMPVFTYVCSLAGINESSRVFTTDEKENLKSLLMNQSMVAMFDHHNLAPNVYSVTLYSADATCINNCFLEEACLIPQSKLKQDLNRENESLLSFVPLLGIQQSLDFDTKVCENGKDVPEETFTGAKDSVPYSSTDGDIRLDSNVKAGSENLDPSIHSVHPSADLDSRVQDACGYDFLTVGRSVDVKVCCIESPQKFWCQTTENEDSLGCLMQDLQNHYASVHPQPIVESICVARNPDDNMWHRAKIIARSNFPVVDVRFIDWGQTQKVPLQHVRPIDPAFLQVNAHAFQCCLFTPTNPTNPTAISCPEAASEFQKFVDLGALSETGLKCVVKAVEYDEEGQILYLVDIETASESACRLLAHKCAQCEARLQSPSVQSSTYSFSSHDIEAGGTEEIWVTSSESVNLFYCQLAKNSHLFEKVKQNVKKQLSQPQCLGQPFEPGSICIAKYTDQKWYRGQLAELSPKIKVQFVDFGDALEVSECDIRSYVSQESIAMDIPVLAIPLGLSNVPAEIPQEVNQWFADQAIGQEFKIAVVAIEENGKLIVEMFDGSVNVNASVTEKVTMKKQHKKQKDSAPTTEECVPKETPHTEIIHLGGQTQSNKNQECVSEENVTPCLYKEPKICKTKMEMVYVSSIVDPDHFWCQGTSTDDLNKLSALTQMAGKTQEDKMLIETLGPGSPCLALYSCDNNWYRAQVMHRIDDIFHVVFIDYGNEAEVDINNVRSLPHSLLEIAPQALFCCLGGFDKSRGSWSDEVYDDFCNLLIDKPLQLRVLSVEDHSDVRVPQYSVEIVCEGELVNTAMRSYWKPGTENFAGTGNLQTENVLQVSQRDSNTKLGCVPDGNVSTCRYKDPRVSKTSIEMVYASCISEPHYFWCQGTDTEVLDKLTKLAQEAGRTQDSICYETLGPGCPCLVLFSSDNKWYRAQTVSKTEDVLHVIFIDYGNESEVDIKNVRSLPQTLLEIPPQAFLCCLSGFDKSKGSWAEEVYDDFYHQLIDKPLKLRVFSVEDHSETKLPQFAVEIESGEMVVNALMEKYWKELEMENTGPWSHESVDQDENRTMAECVAFQNFE